MLFFVFNDAKVGIILEKEKLFEIFIRFLTSLTLRSE